MKNDLLKIHEYRKSFIELGELLSRSDILQLDEVEEIDFGALFDKLDEGKRISGLLEATGMKISDLIEKVIYTHKLHYLFAPLGVRAETVERYSKFVEKHTPGGWVPLQTVGPGIVLGHYLPGIEKPDLPPFLVEYVLISEKAYEDNSFLIEDVELEVIRKDNKYELLEKEKHINLWKEHNKLSFSEALELLEIVYHEQSLEYRKVMELKSVQERSSEDDGEINLDEISIIGDGGVNSLIGQIPDMDVWLLAKDSYSENEFHSQLGLDSDSLVVVNIEEMGTTYECKEVLKKNINLLEAVRAVPIRVEDDILAFASPRMNDFEVQRSIREEFRENNIFLYLTTEKAFNSVYSSMHQEDETEEAINLFYEGSDDDDEIFTDEIEDIDHADYDENDDRVIRFVNKVLKRAIEMQASDIHFEVTGGLFQVRFRLDGKMTKMFKDFPIELAPYAIRRIKVMAKMDTSKVSIPLDGGIKIRMSSRERSLDLRIATCPVINPGQSNNFEKCVMRVLDDTVGPSKIDDVLWIPEQREMFKRVIRHPYGIIIVTGPTGSGKSTTLYSVLSELNSETVNIVTAEDPVERKIAGVNQTPISPPNTFSKQLRSMLRMDPDIILVGEVRDEETADLAVKAAQTGHLVLTTVHANTAADTLARLDGLKVKRHDIASALLCLTAQRLVRRLCKNCKRRSPIQPYELAIMDFKGVSSELIKSGYLNTARGCSVCGNKGVKGRLAVVAMMEITTPIREIIEKKESTPNDLKTYLAEARYMNMFACGLQAVARGEVSFNEVRESITDDMSVFEERLRGKL